MDYQQSDANNKKNIQSSECHKKFSIETLTEKKSSPYFRRVKTFEARGSSKLIALSRISGL